MLATDLTCVALPRWIEVVPDTDWAACTEELASLPPHRIVVLSSDEPLPAESAATLEAATLTLAPDGPGQMTIPALPGDIERITKSILSNPGAASTLAALLRVTSQANPADGVAAEAFAYSALLAGPEHRKWLGARATQDLHRVDRSPSSGEQIAMCRDDGKLTITLNRPHLHNAFGRVMRDQLVSALDLALLDESVSSIELRGAGKSFCAGGDLLEFGTTPDVVTALQVRLEQNVGLRIDRLGSRVSAHLHGACIGAGLEIPAFAGHVVAEPGTWFQLPELSMGLVPGAGGTVSVTRRIGRWRTAYLALTGNRIGSAEAARWGLVDGVR